MLSVISHAIWNIAVFKLCYKNNKPGLALTCFA